MIKLYVGRRPPLYRPTRPEDWDYSVSVLVNDEFLAGVSSSSSELVLEHALRYLSPLKMESKILIFDGFRKRKSTGEIVSCSPFPKGPLERLLQGIRAKSFEAEFSPPVKVESQEG
jgi:hypothetical protein